MKKTRIIICLLIIGISLSPLALADSLASPLASAEDICDFFPDYTLYHYESLGNGFSASASLYRVSDDLLWIKHVQLDTYGLIVSETNTLPLPISENVVLALESETLDKVININKLASTALADEWLDMNRIPVTGRVLQLDIQQDYLIFLVEDDNGGRSLQLVSSPSEGMYQLYTETLLPSDISLDLFHSIDGEIYFVWNGQRHEAGYSRVNNNEWRWSWARYPSADGSFYYSSVFCGVSMYGPWSDGNQDNLIVGSMQDFSLACADPSKLPQTETELKNVINRQGWAVVNNQTVEEREHLRNAPDANAKSLGKLFNGTPLQILEQKGEWTRVAVGLDGMVGWMMTSHLAFGIEMDQVQPAFPQKVYLANLEKEQPAYCSQEMDSIRKLEGYVHIVGVANDNLYIVLTSLGYTGYVPSEWLWEGNG